MKPGINFPSPAQVDILFDIVNVNRGPPQVTVSVGVGDKKRVLSDSFRTHSTMTKGIESAYETSLYNGCKYNERVYTMKGGEFSNGEGKL
ncbi:hypothetical protein SARC_06973 [Sphaeroforma arctica JP610]|uniref:Uncharacterized protein n=1 Tax=Sphaeroforma arctica JP610 TaxID=667725 RepID=A0A0L0FVJ8_9EUKA|nr:hypothetical protein SARC_06973 [Sphaeroforma arctica JP610]KNC80659.1 hypothetical protein SARC_06973 [Sphaeroforma arctica JP610]|eukprot:XP_014154561.1 hypothetical protein SARC_06973 [Sphaeroforma arctica JP610]